MKRDIKAIEKDIEQLRSLLKRYETEITEEEKQMVNRICENAKLEPPIKVDLISLSQLVLKLFDVFKDFFN